jgi:hypothetical protein
MHRIDTSGNVLNRFSEGNPAAGQLATRLSAAWFNDIQENLAYLIEQGAIPLVKGDETQVYDAIVALIASATEGAGGAVPITRLVNAAGLATGGGALAGDITITVSKASAAEVAAGLIDNKAVTPLGLAAAVVKSLGVTGYIKRVDGMIEMWGTATALAGSTTIISLPTTFPTACVWAGVEGGIAVDEEDNNPFVSGRGLSTISVYSDRLASCAVNFKALGY